jgi:uncharacterized protein
VILAPTAPSERIESLDILRGIALFGVLLENMQHFVLPSYAAFVATPAAGALDRFGLAFIRFSCDNKVYLVFSFLFGYGIALQMLRSAAAATGFAGLHLWRMTGLLLIGLAHTLLWTGDILATYAGLGALLLLLRNRSERALHATCLGFLLAPALGLALLYAWAGAAELAPEVRRALEAQVAGYIYPMRQSCFAFAMFALGLSAGRARRLTNPADFAASVRRLLPAALVLGLAGNLASVLLLESREAAPLSASALLAEAATAVGAPALAFCYVFATIWSLGRPALRARLLPVSAVGRATLSNYLLQSLIGVGVLARTGLGPFGAITPPAGIALTFLIFGLQIALSHWWLARFRFGPAEWLWRSITYGELQPLHVADAPR